MKQIIVLTILIIILAATGCATSGQSNKDIRLDSAIKVIFLSEHYSGYTERHIGEIVRVFEKHGFSTTKNRSEAPYYLDFTIDAGSIITVYAALIRDGKTVLEASSSNAGWGTLLARPVAISSRVSAVVSKLDSLLQDINE